MQVPAVYWWYKTPSHAAELTAGYHNPTNQDGYSPVFEILRKHSVTMKFVCVGFHLSNQEANESLIDPEGLSWQVILAHCLIDFFCYALTAIIWLSGGLHEDRSDVI